MKDYEVMAEITIAKSVTVTAPDFATAQIMAKQALEAQYDRLPKQFFDVNDDELVVEIGDATEVKK